jgi:FADH2 O2-dependent halogenase
MLSHTYGFIDPLYSRGLISTFETVHALAGCLINALKTDNFSLDNFSYVSRLQAAQLANTDQIVSTAYRAMSHFELWNAWTQLWLATKMLGDTYIFRTCLKYMETGDRSLLSQLDEEPYPGAAAPFAQEVGYLLQQAGYFLAQVETQSLTPSQGAEGILSLLQKAQSLPHSVYPWGSSEARYIDFNLIFKEWIAWGKTQAPETLQKHLFDFELSPLAFAA